MEVYNSYEKYLSLLLHYVCSYNYTKLVGSLACAGMCAGMLDVKLALGHLLSIVLHTAVNKRYREGVCLCMDTRTAFGRPLGPENTAM